MGETRHQSNPRIAEGHGGASEAAYVPGYLHDSSAATTPSLLSSLKPFDILRYTVYCSFAVVLAVALARQDWSVGSLFVIAVFLAIAIASELLPVTLPDGNAEITLTPIIIWGVIVLFGPGYGALAAFFGVFLGSLLYKRLIAKASIRSDSFWQYLLYNSCQIGTNAGMGAIIYQALGGATLISVDIQSYSLVSVIGPLFAATFVALAMDVFFYAIASAVAESEEEGRVSFDSVWMRAKVIWLKNAFAFLPSYVMFTPFAFVLAYLFVWRDLGFWGVLPILIPFFSVRQTLNLVMANIQTYRQTITTLAMLMQKYHPYTRGHLKRVADLSERLARELRLPAASQQWIWEAGLLHDIGKVGVSEQILDKTARLTDEEWEVIKAHPVKSAEILSQMEFLDALVPWVKYHHERVDGKGYPDGLVGDQIPVEAEIIAVADAFDAMTGSKSFGEGRNRNCCDACGWKPEGDVPMPEECPECGATLIRVYRQPMSVEQGIQQLRYGVGSQFSPRVVRAFIRMMAQEDDLSDR